MLSKFQNQKLFEENEESDKNWVALINDVQMQNAIGIFKSVLQGLGKPCIKKQNSDMKQIKIFHAANFLRKFYSRKNVHWSAKV